MGDFTKEDLDLVSSCIEVAHKVESQKVLMEQAVQIGIRLSQLRQKLAQLVAKPEPEKPKV